MTFNAPSFAAALLLALAVLPGCKKESPAEKVHVVGIKTDAMNYHAALQKQSMWCWAACIQMVLSTRSVSVSQEQIVTSIFGQVIDAPASPPEIIEGLSRFTFTSEKQRLTTVATLGLGPPPPELLISLLAHGVPVIVALSSDDAVGHAVVITAAVYEDQGEEPPIIRRMPIRDPDPMFGSSVGKRELTPEEYGRISCYVLLTDLKPSSK